MTQRSVTLAFFGAAPDTPNMGVSALYTSTIASLSGVLNVEQFVVFDNGLGERHESKLIDGKQISITYFGARGGMRLYRQENIFFILLACLLGKFGGRMSRAVALLDSCDAVLDISGGDSFSDIYGMKRFRNIFAPKKMAIMRNIPLILLPQTYGPFKDKRVLKKASDVVKGASFAWARDLNSFEKLKGLLGPAFKESQHLSGVDMAFGLKPKSAENLISAELMEFIESKSQDSPVVGFNVSGLLYSRPELVASSQDFTVNYAAFVTAFLRQLLEATQVKVVLVSHVMSPPGHYESDFGACQDVLKALGKRYETRVAISPRELDESEVKWLISKLDWFCGTRMHSTIAGMSSGVPTVAISYSDKTIGVFESCGQSDKVFDLRAHTAESLNNALLGTFDARDRDRKAFSEELPKLKARIGQQAQQLADQITQC